MTRADRIARMKDMGILPENATVFPRLPDIPAWDDLPEDQRRASARGMELYAGMVSHMDAQIGRLIAYLKSTGEYDNTLVIFLSDNGPEGTMWPRGPVWDNSNIEDWGRPGTFIQYSTAWAQVSAGPLRMYRGFLSEGGIRVPMIVAGSGVAGSGRISDTLAHIMDVPATILDVAGVPHPETFNGKPVAPLQGKSLAPVLDNTSESVRSPTDWIGWEAFGLRALRMGEWKLLSMCEPYGNGDWQLYDLASDPGESRDLAAEQPQITAQLIGHWAEYAQFNNVILPDASPLCRTPQ
jgi:arylsulfatase A-like enzyme